MPISHADHDHPNSPAARAACRKRLAAGQSPMNASAERALAEAAGVVKAAQITVVPRKRGDGGVVQGMKAAAPKNVKRTNTLIKEEYDLADVPRMLAYGVRMAWSLDLDVRVGDRFTEDEKRLVIQHEVAEIALVWRDKRPDGIWAIFVRNWDSSRTFKVDSVQYAFEVAGSWDAWDEHRNLIQA
jgi:hypothetical protein